MASTAHTPPTSSLFFYGTLMAPSVLHRVISSSLHPKDSSSHTHNITRTPPLHIRPALLPSHRRRHVKGADYPAVTPNATSTVRGSLVQGLSEADVRRLDLFEGDEYERRPVKVRIVSGRVEEAGGVPEPLAYGGVMPTLASEDTNGSTDAGRDGDDGEEVETQTYIWIAPEEELDEGEWDFERFTREKLHLWDGGQVEDSGMKAVDALDAKELNGAVDGTRGRGAMGGEFERAVREREAP